MEFLYEPYFLSLITALIFTSIYYFVQRNKTSEDIPLEENGKRKKRNTKLTPELRSILVFISAYVTFTGLFYMIKNKFFSVGDVSTSIPVLATTTSILENLQQNEFESESEPTTSSNIISSISNLTEGITSTIHDLKENVENKMFKEKIQNDEHYKKREPIDESLIAGKRKSPIKDKESLKHMNSKNVKFADHDVDFRFNTFDLR